MDKLFKDLFEVKDVCGILLIASTGELRYRKIAETASCDLESVDWLSVLNSLAGVKELELVSESRRFYLRRADGDVLVVMMGPKASPAMVRLNCDLVLPALKSEAGKGLRRLFKR